MKNIGTKSINMIDIIVYLAMLSTTIDKILCKDKMCHYLSVLDTIWNLGLFGFPQVSTRNTLPLSLSGKILKVKSNRF